MADQLTKLITGRDDKRPNDDDSYIGDLLAPCTISNVSALLVVATHEEG